MSSFQSQFISSKFIEDGPFSGCWEVMDRETGDFHYLKEVSRSTIDSHQKVSAFSDEISFMLSLKHRLIPSFIDFLNDPESFYIIFEKPKKASIYDKVKQNGKFDESQIQKFLYSLIEIVNYLLNQNKYINWQLSFETIYVNDDGSISSLYPSPSPSSYVLNFTEIGRSRTITPEEITFNNNSNQGEESEKLKKYFSFYTNPKSISWFIGITTYFLSVGCFPFNGKSISAIQNSIIHNHLFFPDFLSKPLKDLLSKLLIKNPQVRLDFNQIENHHFLSLGNFVNSINLINKTVSLSSNTELVPNINESKLITNSFSEDYDDIYCLYKDDKKKRKHIKQNKSNHKDVSTSHSIGSITFIQKDSALLGNDDQNLISDSLGLQHKMIRQCQSSNHLIESLNKNVSKQIPSPLHSESVSNQFNTNFIENNTIDNFGPFSKSSNNKPLLNEKVSITPKKHVSMLQTYGVIKSFESYNHLICGDHPYSKLKKE